jgi:GNAT superfamily N-acetyltransferase
MTADRRGAASALITRVLPDSERLALECPLAFDERFGGELVGLEVEGAVRSACAVLPREFVCGRRRVKVGLIGSVVTDPAYRRRGYMTRLFDLAETRLQALGCAFAVLWADEASVYASRGYVSFGHEVDYWADAALCAALPLFDRVRAAEEGDAEAIGELYAAHSQRVDRTLEETRALLRCPDMDVLVLPRSRDSRELEAYACLGRGRDLTNVVHEWGGAPQAVLTLVRAHQERRLSRGLEPELVLMSPPESALHGVLDSLGTRRFDGILGLAKPLDPLWLARELQTAAEQLEVTLAQGPEGARALIARSPSARRELTLQQVTQALFPPAGDLGAYHYVADSLRTPLRGVPLYPFAWGLDSI